MTEEELILGCKKQERKYQEALYRKYSRKIYGICLRYAQSEPEAEDIMQEVFIKIFRHIPDFEPKGSFEGWIKRISVNCAIEQYRKNRKLIFVENYDEVPVPEFNAMILEKLSTEELLRVITLMPNGYRMVFNLYSIEGYNHREIAEILNISEGTSKSQFSRAKAHLIKLLKFNLDIKKEDNHVKA